MWGRFIDVFRRRRLDADLDAQLAHHLEAGLRRREIGLRLALGAPPISIVWHFLRQGVRVVSLACLCGLAMSAAGSRLLSGMLYGVSTSDPATLSGVVAI